ncbi:MAG: ABC transporter permease [Acidobacteriota bacterium]|nr:ABC transporter permease [Acidobacteriota bacterium]
MSRDRDSGRSSRLRAVLGGFLFFYLGFIVLVILANVLWLGRPGAGGGPSPWTFLWSRPDLRAGLWSSIRLSLVASTITSCLAIVLAVPSAYALSRFRFRGAAVIDTIIDLPIVVPPLLAGVALLIFFRQFPVGRFIEQHIVPVVYTRTGIVVAQFFVASAFSIRAVKAAFDGVNPRFEMVARSLGDGPFRAFRRVALPLARNGIVAGFVMTWARAMGEFGPIMMLAGATPGKTDVLSVSAFLNMSSGHVEASIAIVVLMIGLAAGALIVFKKLGGKGYLW